MIQGRLLGGKVALERAEEAVDALVDMAVEKVDPAQLVPRMWELRGTVSAYDAAYVAAAEALDCPLLTGDRKLARARGVTCEIRALFEG